MRPPLRRVVVFLFLFSMISIMHGQQQQRGARFLLTGNSTLNASAFHVMLQPRYENSLLFTARINTALASAGVGHIVYVAPSFTSLFTTLSVTVTPRPCGVYTGGLWSYADAVSGVCRVCTVCVGQYQVQTCGLTDTVCASSCAAGSYARVGGALGAEEGALGSCSLCARGHFSASSSASACTACDPGYYAAGLGATHCDACEPGITTSLLPGSWACVAVVRHRHTHILFRIIIQLFFDVPFTDTEIFMMRDPCRAALSRAAAAAAAAVAAAAASELAPLLTGTRDI